MDVTFTKYEGSGNDFIMIDNRNLRFPADEQLIARLCNRRFGIGADGLILLEPCDKADFYMRYHNSDGKESTFCGNGGRCAAAFAAELGIVQSSTTFLAKDGIHQATLLPGKQVRLKMRDTLHAEPSAKGYLLNTGSPHLVLFVEDVDKVDVFTEGRNIRHTFWDTGGVNVNFVEKAGRVLRMRTYERGVEDETLSCGTGVTAAALLAHSEGFKSPVKVETRGGSLQVEFSPTAAGFSEVYLTGPVSRVFSGTFSDS
jgi:diaminopimelate epimerase